MSRLSTRHDNDGAHSPQQCPWHELYGRGYSLSGLRVVNDPTHVCTRWRTAELTKALRPMWVVRSSANDSSGMVATRVLPSECNGSPRGQCSSSSPALRWCALSVARAVVLPSGLVVNETHRFNLKASHVSMDKAWAPTRLDESCSDKPRMRPFARLWSFRQLFADNPLHTLFQVLPLLGIAMHLIERDANATVLAPSRLFKAVAERILPPDRVILTNAALAAETVHLVVGRPPFSPLSQTFAAGCLRRMRLPAPPLAPATATGTMVLFLPRGRTHSRSRQGVRDLSTNQAALLAATRSLLRRRSHAQLEVFEFRSSLKKQQEAFSSARVVVGPQGTAFSGLAFCRRRVTIVEWALRRDEDWAVAEYFGLDADYYQLMPRWTIEPTVRDCNASRVMDECPWHLEAADMALYAKLLNSILVGTDPAATAASLQLAPPMHFRTSEEAAREEWTSYRSHQRV